MKEDLAKRLAEISEKIKLSAEKSGRQAKDIELIAVSKTHPAEVIKLGLEAGIRVFGENKVQEAQKKFEEIGNEKARWHLIGHLQANKARKAVKIFDVIQTLDSIDLAERIERLGEEEKRASIDVLIQVNLGEEATKSGISEKDLPLLVNFLRECKFIKLKGLMTIPPYFEEVEKVRPYFRKLREIRDKFLPEGELSMGMSHDFETAIEEGATMVRIGTAIFGERNYA